MGVTASALSLMARHLERGGYLRRQRGKRDRVDLRLTATGGRGKRQRKVERVLVAASLRRLSLGKQSVRWKGWNCWPRRRAA